MYVAWGKTMSNADNATPRTRAGELYFTQEEHAQA